MKLSPAQQELMDIFNGKHWFQHPEKDGSYLPTDRRIRTAESLVKKGLLKHVWAGKDGFKYSGYALK